MDDFSGDPLVPPFRYHGYGSQLAAAIAVWFNLAGFYDLSLAVGNQKARPAKAQRINA
jgi:hypothetical protein